MPIPSLQLQEKIEKTCLMQRSRRFGHGVMASKICCNAVIVLSTVICDCCKPMNSCRDWAFSNSGLEVGLPAFQLPMFAKCDAVPNEVWSTCSFKTKASITAIPFWNVLVQSNFLPQAWGSWEQYSPSALHYGCIMHIPSLQLHEKPVS